MPLTRQEEPVQETSAIVAARKRWERAQNLPPGPVRHREIIEALTELAELDAEFSLAAAKKIDEVKLRHDAIEAVIQRIGRANPEEGWEIVSAALYDAVFRQWMEYDRNGAAQWLASQSPSPLLDRPIERYTWRVMEIDPQNSMPWAESITDSERRFRVMTEVADRWGRRDPQGLASYVSSTTLPPQQKERLLRNAQPRRQ